MRPQPQPEAAAAAGHAAGMDRRAAMISPLLALCSLALSGRSAQASPINPAETAVTLPDAITWKAWNGAPPGSAEIATLPGSLDAPGPTSYSCAGTRGS